MNELSGYFFPLCSERINMEQFERRFTEESMIVSLPLDSSISNTESLFQMVWLVSGATAVVTRLKACMT